MCGPAELSGAEGLLFFVTFDAEHDYHWPRSAPGSDVSILVYQQMQTWQTKSWQE